MCLICIELFENGLDSVLINYTINTVTIYLIIY